MDAEAILMQMFDAASLGCQVSEAMQKLVKHHPRMFWKTITSELGDPRIDALLERVDQGAQLYGRPLFEVHDVRALSRQSLKQHMLLFWDSKHYLCVMYEQMNDVLLNTLCDNDLNFV